MPRPLFRKSITELEAMFWASQGSPEQLRVLVEELAHRKTNRAVVLHEQVLLALKSGPADLPSDSEIDEDDSTSEDTPPLFNEAPDDLPAHEEPDSGGADFGGSISRGGFARIQHMGVRPRPSAFRPTLKNDLQLPVSPKAPRPRVFCAALTELIREMKRRKVGFQQFILEDGERIATDAGGYSYQFEFTEEANIFEGAKVELIIGGRTVPGQLTGILQGRIIITLQDDFGPRIKTCTLRIDNTALLQALHDRLQSISEGNAPGFRGEFAECVLKNAGTQQPGGTFPQWPWAQEPTASQRRFVELALGNEISWLFGPPGTGKTVTLSALTRLLYEQGKRILICSNTNKAVDQLLHKLCERMKKTNDPALKDGRVVRLGTIEDDLDRDFGELVIPDRIVERKAAELKRRKDKLASELEQIGQQVSHAEEVLKLFAQLDVVKAKAERSAQDLQKAKAEIEGAQIALAAAQQRFNELETKLGQRQQAGTFRRIFMRNEQAISRDLVAQKSRVQAAEGILARATTKTDNLKTATGALIGDLKLAEEAVKGEDHDKSAKVVAGYSAQRQKIRDELADIEKRIEDIRNAVLREAHIVGATVTRTFLRPVEFAAFDTVIVDEASMILLPAVYQVAGLATERVVIAGDFQQLPPIIQTEQKSIHDILAPDVFAEAGIELGGVTAGHVSRLVMLDEQHRMDDSICQHVSRTFYRGVLRTSPKREAACFDWLELLKHRLTIIDTSSIWPFTTRNAFNSRLNLMHALAVRNLILHLRDEGKAEKGMVGVCTPYAAQAKLLREILQAHDVSNASVRASTVHGFQGDERELIVIDLVDSIGERAVGIFLQAERAEEAGAKLLNVALSRAKEGVTILANLTFLDQKLPSNALLRGLLHDIQRTGHVVDVREVLALRPILKDLQRFATQPDLDPEALRTGLFSARDFAKMCRLDMESAKKSIVVFSGFITQQRAAQMGDVFRQKIQQGVKVRCVTRPPNRNGSIPVEEGRAALMALESIGVAIDLRNEIHEKAVVIDGKVTWFGSLNPLSNTPRTTELMARVDNAGFAAHLAGMLSLRRRSQGEPDNSASTEPENPRCGNCGQWSVLIRGKFGPFFVCANGCEWKQNLDGPRRR